MVVEISWIVKGPVSIALGLIARGRIPRRRICGSVVRLLRVVRVYNVRCCNDCPWKTDANRRSKATVTTVVPAISTGVAAYPDDWLSGDDL